MNMNTIGESKSKGLDGLKEIPMKPLLRSIRLKYFGGLPKTMNTKKIVLTLLLLVMFSQVGCSYISLAKSETNDSGSYNLTAPSITSLPEKTAGVAESKNAVQIISDAFLAAGYSEPYTNEAVAYFNAWQTAKSHYPPHYVPDDYSLMSAEIVPFQARMQFSEESVDYSISVTDTLQTNYLISIWNPSDSESPFEIQRNGYQYYVRHPINISECERAYQDFFTRYYSTESVDLIADLLASSKYKQAKAEYASAYYETMLTAFFCNNIEPSPLKRATLIDFPQDLKRSPGQGQLIPAALEVTDLNDNVIQIIHTNPKYLTSEGVSAVRYNSALIFWRALIKD